MKDERRSCLVDINCHITPEQVKRSTIVAMTATDGDAKKVKVALIQMRPKASKPFFHYVYVINSSCNVWLIFNTATRSRTQFQLRGPESQRGSITGCGPRYPPRISSVGVGARLA